MKTAKTCLAFALTASFLVSPSAFADKETTGTIIGGIIGAIAGSQTGRSNGAKTRGTIIGGLIGALVGNRVGNDMDKQDRDAYERTSRDCFDGPVGRDLNWQGNKYRGNVRSTREGFRHNRGRREVCREFHSEIYRGNSVETVDGVVCRGPNGWEKRERREVIFDNGGYDNGPVGGPIDRPIYGGSTYGSDYGGTPINNGVGFHNSQSIDLGFLSPVSRRTGGEYLTINLAGKNLRSITVQASGDKLKIYRVIATSINGNQTELQSAQLNTFLFLGSRATFDLNSINGQIVRLDVLVEAWAGGLGLSVTGEIFGVDRRNDGLSYSQPILSCEAIAQINSSNASICTSELAGKYIQPSADSVCAKIARSNSSNAVQCVRAAANNRFSDAGLEVCSQIAEINSSNAAICVDALANKRIDERFVNSCIQTAQSNSSSAVNCVRGIVIGNL